MNASTTTALVSADREPVDEPTDEPRHDGGNADDGPDRGATRGQRAALGGVLAVASVLYLWALDSAGTVNEYYAQAVSAGSNSWSSMFFGSLDTGNFITVDKPPLSLWVQSTSVRLFGFHTWSILVPQVLAGLGTIWLTHDAVRRIWGRWAGIAAAAALAVTPITVAMTRSNLPDPVMILCLVAGAWMLTRALTADTRPLAWLVGAFAMVGLGFEAKMLQAWIVLPGFAAAYLLFGPRRWVGRLRELAFAGLACLSVSFAWALTVESWPGDAPWIGGSDNGSVFDLIFGYNGLGRIFGEGAAGDGGSPFDDGVSWLRMFNADNAHQIAWLLPAAAGAIVLGVVVARTTRSRLTAAGVTLWGGWALTHLVVFSRAEGIYHPYYTSAMAPALAALIGAGAAMAWRWRDRREVVVATALVLVASALLAWTIFDRAGWNTWVGPVVTVAALAAATALIGGSLSDRRDLVLDGLVGGLAAVLIAMGVYAGASLVSAGEANPSPSAGPADIASLGGAAPVDGPVRGGPASPPPQDDLALPGDRPAPGVLSGGADLADRPVPGDRPGVGGLSGNRLDDVEGLADWLLEHRDGETWIVAVSGTNSASQVTLAADGAPVMTMGGFNGSDPTPTATELADYVAGGEVRFVVTGGATGPGADATTAQVAAERTAWIESTCALVDGAPVDGLYDCAAGAGA